MEIEYIEVCEQTTTRQKIDAQHKCVGLYTYSKYPVLLLYYCLCFCPTHDAFVMVLPSDNIATFAL